MSKLRIGVLLDSKRQERWVVDEIRAALEIRHVELACIVLVDGTHRRSLAGIVYRVLNRIDTVLRCPRDPQLVPIDVPSAFASPSISRILAELRGDTWVLDKAGIAHLRDASADLWLSFTAIPPGKLPASVSSIGAWGFEIGRGVAATNLWAGAGEVCAGSPVTEISVRDYCSMNCDVVYRSVGATIGNSVQRNRVTSLRRVRGCLRRVLFGMSAGRRRPRSPLAMALPEDYPVAHAPGFGQVLQLVCRLLAEVAANRWYALRCRRQWQIGYQFADGHELGFDELRYLEPSADRFWADPFAVERDGRYFIFFEELEYAEARGRIMAVEVFENREPGVPRVVLERPYHLSYPFIFEWQGELYMIPETAENSTIELYHCHSFPFDWRLQKVLLRNIRAYDTTLWQGSDRWWMFVSVAPHGTDGNDQLHIYYSDNPLGLWHAHRANPVVTDARFARPAGPLFTQNGKLYRPGQDCSLAYGYAISINRVDRLDTDNYRETPVHRIRPVWRQDARCAHTLGGGKRLKVVDYLVDRRRFGAGWAERTTRVRNAGCGI